MFTFPRTYTLRLDCIQNALLQQLLPVPPSAPVQRAAHFPPVRVDWMTGYDTAKDDGMVSRINPENFDESNEWLNIFEVFLSRGTERRNTYS